MGYEGFFMARQDVLRLLYESLEDKSRVHTSKRVVSIQELDDSAVVEAADGSSFFCDFVAGADGVRSVVRDHILAATAQPPLGCKWGTLIRNVRGVSDSLEDLRAEAACVFGISKPIPQIPAGRHFTVYRPKVSGLVFAGLNGRLYWFLFKLLPEPIEYGKATSYTQADIDEVIANISDAPVTDGVRWCDVWAAREQALMTALEEGLSHSWKSGRMLLLGDSVHKVRGYSAVRVVQPSLTCPTDGTTRGHGRQSSYGIGCVLCEQSSKAADESRWHLPAHFSLPSRRVP